MSDHGDIVLGATLGPIIRAATIDWSKAVILEGLVALKISIEVRCINNLDNAGYPNLRLDSQPTEANQRQISS